MGEKIYLNPAEFLLDSFHLAKQVYDSGFQPNFLVGIWRGGTTPGIAVQEYLAYRGISTDHIAVRTSSYTGIDERDSSVHVHGLDYLIKRINAEDRLLIVDDVHDTGLSIQALLGELQKRTRRNLPAVKVATVYYKPGRNQTGFVPDFYVHATEEWIVFPHELHGLSPEEILLGKGKEIAALLGLQETV